MAFPLVRSGRYNIGDNKTDIVIIPPELSEITDNEGIDTVVSDANY